jgi:hypothetical protein
MDEQQIELQWRDISTDLTECYETTHLVARGVVSRPRNAVSDYSAYLERAGRSQWARQRFGDLQDAKAWCELALADLSQT